MAGEVLMRGVRDGAATDARLRSAQRGACLSHIKHPIDDLRGLQPPRASKAEPAVVGPVLQAATGPRPSLLRAAPASLVLAAVFVAAPTHRLGNA